MIRARRSLFGAGAIAAALLVLCASALAAPAGTGSLVLKGSTDLGHAQAKRTIVVVLLGSHPAALRAFVSQPHHRILSSKQFTAQFGPSPAAVVALRRWAANGHLRIVSVSANRELVSVRGTTGALGRALKIKFDRFKGPRGNVYVSSVGTAQLPAALAPQVLALVGLSDLQVTHTGLGTPAPPAVKIGGLPVIHPAGVPSAAPSLPGVSATSTNYPASYKPQDFWSMYNAPSANTGAGQQTTVIAEGDVTQAKNDLVTFENTFGLAHVAWNQINVGAASSDTAGADEWDLDTQYSTGFAPGVSQVNVYVSTSMNNADILNTVTRWITDNTTKQASFSAGECESLAYASGFEASLDAQLQQADAQGQSLFVASGDTGSQCPALLGVNGVPAGEPGTDYPAASPFAIGVGGTTVLSNNPLNEVAWAAGGGGITLTEAPPAFQATAGGSFTNVDRGVPDVSLDADPNSGYDVIVNGQEQVIGGTSASAPAWQGIWCRAQAAHNGTLGFAGPVLYTTEPRSAYHDILLGGNGLYAATPSWDYVTGLGTPDITAFVNGA